MSLHQTTNSRLRIIWLSLSPLVAALFLFLGFAAVTPALHEKLHDLGSHQETCAVCSLNHHQVLSISTVDSVQVAQSPRCNLPSFVFVASVVCPSFFSANQGRSPPSFA
jgi:hypothetical protein